MKLGDLILLCNTSTVMSALLSRGKPHAIGSGDLFLVLATLYCQVKTGNDRGCRPAMQRENGLLVPPGQLFHDVLYVLLRLLCN